MYKFELKIEMEFVKKGFILFLKNSGGENEDLFL